MFVNWPNFPTYVLQLEQQGVITRTFRRLDPQRQQAVIDAILVEATEKGPAAISIKAVAHRAGVAVGSLYQYFPNRDGLLDFAVAFCTRYLTDLFNESRPYLLALPLREALQAYLAYGVEWGQTETGLIRFFGKAAYQGAPELAGRLVRPIADLMRGIVRDLLGEAARRGEIRPDVDLDAAARTINMLMIAIGDSQLLPYLNTYFQVTDQAMPLERVIAATVDMILKGTGI
jgi:AcrR family transcriptional regulator